MTEKQTDTTPIEDVNSDISEEAMLEAMADDFFQDEEDLPVEEEDTVEADEEESDAEEAETDETNEDDGELETEDEEDEGDVEDVDPEDPPSEEESAELDMEYEVPIKIDGEESTVSLKELVKGYQTNQHANKKSIEASEKIKQVEQIFEEVTRLKSENSELMKLKVDKDQQQIEAYDAKIKKLIMEDDVFELPKWQEARRIKSEQLKKNKEISAFRETEAKDLSEKQQTESFNRQKSEAIDVLNDQIPGWDKTYDSVVDWAVTELGFPEFAEIMDPRVVSLMYDYKSLKEGKSKAVKKRLKAPTKSVKPKKSSSLTTKQVKRDTDLRSKVLSGKGSTNDELSFLEGIAGKILS